MATIIDPNAFRVPYAIGADDIIYQIKDGRPASESLFCPICRTAVSFIRETEERAAHFRHHRREECDSQAAYHRQTLHDAVRDAAMALLDGGTTPRRLCNGGTVLPTGKATPEAQQRIDGRAHRPDILIEPKDGEAAPTLELEVVYSHRPEPARIERAARDGRLIAVLDIEPVERDYYRKLWASQAFDIPSACKEYVLTERFTVMDNADVRRIVSGILGKRNYLEARIRPEDMPREQLMKPSGSARGARNLPTRPPTCGLCGQADWAVAMTLEDGRKAHVGCAPDTKIWRGPQAKA